MIATKVCAVLVFCAATALADSFVSPLSNGNTVVPFIASLRIDGRHICSGAIINSQWIITAARCINPGSNITIFVGARTLRDGQPITIDRTIVHPQYRPAQLTHDIALLRTNERIPTIPGRVQPIPISPVDPELALQQDASESVAFSAGWGHINNLNNQTIAPVAPRTIIKAGRISGANRCRQNRQTPYPVFVHPTSLCWNAPNAEQRACAEDVGSPLYNLRGELIGIASWRTRCGQAAGVFTNIFPYRNAFIEGALLRDVNA